MMWLYAHNTKSLHYPDKHLRADMPCLHNTANVLYSILYYSSTVVLYWSLTFMFLEKCVTFCWDDWWTASSYSDDVWGISATIFVISSPVYIHKSLPSVCGPPPLFRSRPPVVSPANFMQQHISGSSNNNVSKGGDGVPTQKRGGRDGAIAATLPPSSLPPPLRI